jgi:hypothetical protein
MGITGLALPSIAGAWGERIHDIVNRRAVDCLPDPARTAWASLASSLGAHAGDADHRKGRSSEEPPRHYIDIDLYDTPPFDRVPRDREKLAGRLGDSSGRHWGVAPWAIEECYRMVVRSLELGDWGSAVAWAADLGHYVADTHQPLHCTLNYDGQRTGNRGVHLRFEVHLMNRHFDPASLRPCPTPQRPEEGPLEACFDWIAAAYEGIEEILAADTAASTADPDHGDRYYGLLWQGTRGVAEAQVERAISDLAALYLAAWEEAGRPPGPDRVPPFRALPRDLLERGEKGPDRASLATLVLAGGILLGAFVLAAG